MNALPAPLRRLLENAAQDARDVAEAGALAALNALAVAHAKPFAHLSEPDKKLRVALRAQARQLGDAVPKDEAAPSIAHLVEKVAYDTWHRLLFTRFLAENRLLQHPGGASMTLQDCDELIREDLMQPQREFSAPDGRTLAVEFAARMLPAIFRADDPAGKITLPPENRNALFKLIDDLPRDVFLADDSLGWCYQFWQARRKEAANRSGRKIGANELPAVTQLFTEHYMVLFLLHNTIGAWWAGRKLTAENVENAEIKTEEEARRFCAVPGVDWEYLRFVKGDTSPRPSPQSGEGEERWRPAAGAFEGWPKTLREFRLLDPCCGSGHFLVAAFILLVWLRMQDEGLSARDACDAVLRENLHGLELDPRCTQIAAFNLALTAWKFPGAGGYRPLPTMHVACSGLGVNARKEDWLALANGNDRLRQGMERLHALFQKAPELGSLIDPRTVGGGDLVTAGFAELEPLLGRALQSEKAQANDELNEMGVAAQGMARAAELLASQFTLVVTNVPFLGYREMDQHLLDHVATSFPSEKGDLGYCLWRRFHAFVAPGQTTALVTLQHWLSLQSYTEMRKGLLTNFGLQAIAHLGTGAFETISGEKVNVTLTVATKSPNPMASDICLFDVADRKTPNDKAKALKESTSRMTPQAKQYANPDHRISFGALTDLPCLSKYADCLAGIMNGDSPKFIRNFWEIPDKGELWTFLQSTVSQGTPIGGLESVILFDEANGHLREEASIRRVKLHNADERGNAVWGRPGVAISQMSSLPASRYFGNKYDSNIAAIVPRRSEHLAAIWAFCSSGDFYETVRAIDRKLNVTNATFGKVPFDLSHWQRVAAEKYPDGLPRSFSSDPTQWLFSGHPTGAENPLQVAVGRLLGYRWPRQTGSSFPDCPSLEPDGLEPLADDDGIVCIPAAGQEQPAENRLRALLAAAYGAEWSAAKEGELLAQAGYAGKSMEDWLGNGFAEQHGKLFHQRPFIWHLWDGRKDGFSALVNYHKLDHALLDKLIYTYLGDWITRQESGVQSGEGGSDARLTAGRDLQRRLKLIAEGEPPFDIFVRWKPLAQQPVGWEPDLNDGVRLNVRPFVEAGVLRKDPNVNWKKDRGADPASAPWFAVFHGERINDHHLTVAEKRAARQHSATAQ